MNYVSRPHVANLLLDPTVAHVVADGSGTHADIAAANSSGGVTTILVYPGTHTIDNSSASLTLTKHLISLGGRSATTLVRTSAAREAILTTGANRIIRGFTFSYTGYTQSGSDSFFIRYDTQTLSRSVIQDINCIAVNGILTRRANNLSLQEIYSVNVGLDFPNISIQVGDSTQSSSLVVIRNCIFQATDAAGVKVYRGNAKIYNSIFTAASLSTDNSGILIDSANDGGDISSNSCIFDGVINPVNGVLTSSDPATPCTYTSTTDTFKNHTYYCINLSGTGVVVSNGTSYFYDPVGTGNFLFNLASTVENKGYYFDTYLGQQINLGDSRSYGRFPLLKYSNFFE